MNSDLQQTIIETKREELIEILKENGCTIWDAAEFALQEYVMGVPNGEYNYHEYHEHFNQRYLRDSEGEHRFGTAMYGVMQQLFYKHISKGYSLIKNTIYDYMEAHEHLPEDERVVLKDFGHNLSEMTDYVIYFKLELMKTLIDMQWNIVAKPKTITKPNKKK